MDEQVTSFRPEAAGLGEGVSSIPLEEDFDALVDNESVLTVTAVWIGTSHQPSPMATADSDLMMQLIEHTGRRTGKSRFHK
eukprot:1294053-Rhodomonas_salina.1